ncbi:C4-dicarboxylate ABC transporter [Candidatus Gracilibacteria bacterium]|nr:C4-dicarboxylate ABC transporter [Candidatus Gracilibacteria bacterium]NUJ99176.1 C4-dicarboxylate ABC transporter [Candidatus Gracilibacteria bacterium]
MLFKKEGCRLKYFNIAFYASVMGFGGLSIATHKLEEVYKTGSHIGYFLLIISFLYFIIISGLYLIKMFINFDDVKADFVHSVKSNFFPGIGKILFLFAIGFMSSHIIFAKYLWIIGAIIQFFFTIIILRRWIQKEMDIKEMNPLWFIPVVGNMIAPIAGLKLGFGEISLFLFAIGFILWAVLFTIIINRILFHHPLHQKLLPTLFILIAPPSIAFISYTNINAGNIDLFGKMLYYFALFLFLVVFSQINVLKNLKFYLSWWAYSFPMAALTIASLLFYNKTQFSFISFLSIFFFALLVIIIIILIYKTILGIKKKELCTEES